MADLARVHYKTLSRLEPGGIVVEASRQKLEKAFPDAGRSFRADGDASALRFPSDVARSPKEWQPIGLVEPPRRTGIPVLDPPRNGAGADRPSWAAGLQLFDDVLS